MSARIPFHLIHFEIKYAHLLFLFVTPAGTGTNLPFPDRRSSATRRIIAYEDGEVVVKSLSYGKDTSTSAMPKRWIYLAALNYQHGRIKNSLLLVALAIQTTDFAADLTGTVVGVINGETIEVLNDHHTERVRLRGIDCPEKDQILVTLCGGIPLF